MLAIDSATSGGPEVLVAASHPVPVPQPGEVLIRVVAAGVNRADILQRKGLYPPPPGASTIYGLEVAGEIVARGDGVDAAHQGQAVCALLAGGGYAEYCAVPIAHCLPVPANISMTEAAALPEALFTVWTNVFERAYAVEGDDLLVHGGTTGIGTMAIALGKLFGLNVIVTCGSDAKCAAARALGAAHAINYRTTDFVAAVASATGGKGVEVVLDMVGGDYVARNLRCLAPEGRHVSIATQGGMLSTVNLLDVMQRRVVLTGSTLRGRDAGFKALVAEELARVVWPHVAAGRLRATVDTCFPLAQAAAAHQRMEDGAHVGKIILEL